MPINFASTYKRHLKEVLTTLNGIRHSAVEHVNDQNFNVSERLRSQLETIRISVDTILETFTKASVTSYTLDDRIIDWLTSGGLHLCLDKLKQLDDMLKPVVQPRLTRTAPRHPKRTEDKLVLALSFFNKHERNFHFLLSLDIWNRGSLLHQSSSEQSDDDYAMVESGQNTRLLRTSVVETTRSDTDLEYQTAREEGTESVFNDGNSVSEDVFLQKKLDEVSRWLAPLDCTEKHNDMHKMRQEGTCKWFPHTDAYKMWRLEGNKFLWVHGKAGCGKSVLIASAIEHLKTTLRKQEVVIYFYCDFRSERSTKATELMRSLLSQLLQLFFEYGINPGDFPSKILEQKSQGTLLLNDFDRLSDLVSHAATYFDYYPIIVIDALDECADLEELLQALYKLNLGDVRLLVTSRPLPIIKDRFKRFRSLSFEDVARETSGDIALHINRELDSHEQLRSIDRVIKNEIGKELNRRAEGRFRWVQCQLDILERCTSREELRETLRNLPDELETTYERILGAIDERNLEGTLARRALAWLVAAMEPLHLVQIVDGFSINALQVRSEHEMQGLGAALLHALSSLVTHNGDTDVIALSHYTVMEYLTSGKALPTYQIISRVAHGLVTETCMHYISVYLTQVQSHDDTSHLRPFPMLSYILSSGFRHLANVDPESCDILEALIVLGSNVRHHPTHWEFLCKLREEIFGCLYPPWPSIRHDFVTYILIAFASPGLLRSFLSGIHYPKPRVGTNGLVYAADLRRTDHAMTLLQFKVDVNRPGFVVDDSRYALPLEAAIDLNDDVLVSELLQRGSVVTAELLTTAVCMPWCSTRVLVKLLQTDAFLGWADEIGDEKLYRSVFNSARPNAGDRRKADEDHVTLARILCQVGVDLSADSPFGMELIERAVYAAHTLMLDLLLPFNKPPPTRFLFAAATGDTPETQSVVRFLLDRGVDVHAVSDSGGDTALHIAIICPWEPRRLELTQMLVCAGCNPHALNDRGETPFLIALKRGYVSVLDRLLSCGTLFPPDILLEALQERCSYRSIQWLVLNGANVHVVSQWDGNTVLHISIANYSESMCLNLLKIFADAGSNFTTCNFEGQSVLEAALLLRYTSVVELLLSYDASFGPNIILIALEKSLAPQIIKFLILKGANIYFTTPDENSVLHLAISEYDEASSFDLVNIFIDSGCNISVVDTSGQTALDMSIGRGYNLVVDLLLSHDVPFNPDILQVALEKTLASKTIKSLVLKGAHVHITKSGGNPVFHLAISKYPEEVCLDMVTAFIEAADGCDLTVTDSSKQTALDVAICRGYTSVVELLLSHDASFQDPNILLIALEKGLTPQIIQSLILKGASVFSTTSDGNSVLHLLVPQYPESACLGLVDILIEAGYNPTTCNVFGQTALDVAIICGYISVVELFISRNIPLRDDVLPFALQYDTPPQMIRFLCAQGADVHATMPNGDSLFHLTIAGYMEPMCLDLFGVFIEAGCDPIAANNWGETALDVAIDRGQIRVAELLLSRGASLRPDALLFALQRLVTLEMIQFLISNGVDVQSTAPDGDTALHIAFTRYHLDESESVNLIHILIKAGCNVFASNHWGHTALDVAISCGYTLAAKLLLSYNAPLRPDAILISLSRHATFQMVNILINQHADVHATTPGGDSALHLAVYKYFEEMCLEFITIFIEAGCNLAITNILEETVLDVAVCHGYASVVEHLLTYDAPFHPDILLIALERCLALQTIRSLILKGANIHATTSSGNSLLHLAISNYPESTCLGLVNLLIKFGCGLVVSNNSGETALDLAIDCGYISIAELLLAHNVPLRSDVVLFALRRLVTPNVVEFLALNGADLQFATPDGESMVRLALAVYDDIECLNLISNFSNEIGINNLTSLNPWGQTNLDVALCFGYTMVVRLLLSQGVPLRPDALLTALWQYSTLQMVETLISQGANVHTTTPGGDSLFHLAVARYPEEEFTELMNMLVEAGCDLAATNALGETPLDIAIARGYTSIAELLLSHDVPLRPDVLLFALTQHSTLGMIGFLISQDADVQSATTNGDTVLHLALSDGFLEFESTELVILFVNSGCDPNARNSAGMTVMEAAIKHECILVVEFLLARNVLLPPDILQTALRHHCTPQTIRELVDILSFSRIASPVSDWDALQELVCASYNEQHCSEITLVLCAFRMAMERYLSR